MSEPTTIDVFDPGVQVDVTVEAVAVDISDDVTAVTVDTPGIQGVPGPAGQDGVTTVVYENAPQAYYRHVQDTPAAVWSIPHPLGYRPTVTVSDTAGTVIHGDVYYPSDSLVEASFSVAFTGIAYLT